MMSSLRTRNSTQNGKQHSSKKKSVMSGTAPDGSSRGFFCQKGAFMSGKTKKKIRWKEFLPYYLLALPGVIYMICNNYLPMFGVIIAFKNLNFRKGILGSDWCGLDNFKFLFASKVPLPSREIRFSTTWPLSC